MGKYEFAPMLNCNRAVVVTVASSVLNTSAI